MVSSQDEVVTIYTSKLKSLAMVSLSLGFVTIGVGLFYMPFLEPINIFLLLIVHATSLFIIILFGSPGIYAATRLFDKKPALVLDSVGIIDRSNAVSVGRIPWQDIRKVNVRNVRGYKFLTLHVANSQRYVQRGNFFQRQIHAFNHKFQGSFIEISSSSLKISFSKLSKLVVDYHHRYTSNSFD